MFKKIRGNLNLDLFCEILLNFDQVLRLNCVKTKKYFLRYYLLLIANLLGLNTVFLPPLSFLFFFSCRGKGSVSGNTQVQGHKKTLNNPQLRGLKNMLHRVGTINLKLENWINSFFTYRHLTQNQSQKFKIAYYTYTCSFICDVLINFCTHFWLYLSIYPLILFSFNCIIKRPIFLSILEILCQHSPESLLTFFRIFLNILENLLEHSPES